MGTVQKLNRLEEITREEQEEGAERLRRMGRTNIGNTIEDVMKNIPTDSDYYTKEQIDELLNDYVRKVEGKGLSTEDYTSSEKAAVNTISNKADKVTSAVAGNLAKLDASGNIKDSGTKAADFEIEGTATGTSITLTNSADGYVQKISVKGHSEVVSGEIKSIGDAGWGVVDLGTLTYTKLEQGTAYAFRALIDNSKTYNAAGNSDIICSKFPFGYATTSQSTLVLNMPDKTFGVLNDAETHFVYFKDTTYTDTTAFKSAMSGVLLYYPFADATGATPTLGITSKDGAGQGTAVTITTGLPLRSVSDTIFDTADNDKVTKKCAKVDLGDLTWAYNEVLAIFHTSLVTAPLIASAQGLPCVCENYDSTYGGTWGTWSNFPDKHISCGCNYSTSDYENLAIKDTDYTDAATFKTAMSGVKLVYSLATPTETPLSAAEKSALSSLRTYNPNTQIDVTDSPNMTVDYLLNTDNGQAAAKIDSKIPQVIDETVTLAYFRWNGDSAPYTQTLYVPGVLASDKLMLDVSISNNIATGISQKEQWAYITKVTPSNDHITFSCYESRPTIDLSVNIRVVR